MYRRVFFKNVEKMKAWTKKLRIKSPWKCDLVNINNTNYVMAGSQPENFDGVAGNVLNQ